MSATVASERWRRRFFAHFLILMWSDVDQGCVGELGQDVVAEVTVVFGPGSFGDVVGVAPDVTPFAQGGLGCAGVGEGSLAGFVFDVGCAVAGLVRAGKAGFAGECAVWAVVADTPA